MIPVEHTLVYAVARSRAADTARIIEEGARRPFTKNPLERMNMEATKDDADRARQRARAAAWEATYAFCREHGVSLGGKR